MILLLLVRNCSRSSARWPAWSWEYATCKDSLPSPKESMSSCTSAELAPLGRPYARFIAEVMMLSRMPKSVPVHGVMPRVLVMPGFMVFSIVFLTCLGVAYEASNCSVFFLAFCTRPWCWYFQSRVIVSHAPK